FGPKPKTRKQKIEQETASAYRHRGASMSVFQSAIAWPSSTVSRIRGPRIWVKRIDEDSLALLCQGGGLMSGTNFGRWLSVSITILTVLLWPGLGTQRLAASATDQDISASRPNRDLITALPAMGPHPSLGDKANVFGRFVGTWDVEYNRFTEDGK